MAAAATYGAVFASTGLSAHFRLRILQAFAQIKGGLVKFIGVSDSQLIADEKPVEDWPAQIDQWRTALANLADEFCSGYANMEVFDKGAFNFQTDLLPLNRWLEEPEISAKLAEKIER